MGLCVRLGFGTALDLISLLSKRHLIMKINQIHCTKYDILFRLFEESNFESVFNLGIQRKTNFKHYYA